MSIQACLRLQQPGFTLDVDLCLPARGITVLSGPSGCGKTTLLRCLAGLEPHAQGRLLVNGELWQDRGIWLPTHRRGVGMVFQNPTLFPHLSVRKNIEYGLKRSRRNKKKSLARIVELLEIDGLLDRKPNRLSGGEQQRVALARALAASPRLLLLDEPLTGLDQDRKKEILPYLQRLPGQLDLPLLYVTHSRGEMVRLAHYLVLMRDGSVLGHGPVGEMLNRSDLFPCCDPDAGVVVETRISGYDSRYRLSRL